MIFGMQASDFWAFGIWPILWTALSIFAWFYMDRLDKREEEYEKQIGMRGDNE